MRIALFQPDIPQNTGAILRLAACLGLEVDIIGPAGFSLSDRALKRAGLDYAARTALHLFEGFEQFHAARLKNESARLVLATTRAESSYLDHRFCRTDIVLLGRESAGAPDWLHERAGARIKIPLRPGNRSLNQAVAAAMILGEALRQTGGFAA